jgi:hypothetical protein
MESILNIIYTGQVVKVMEKCRLPVTNLHKTALFTHKPVLKPSILNNLSAPFCLSKSVEYYNISLLLKKM